MAKTKSAYGQKLLDPRWQRLRLEILNRDEWQCQACGDFESTLHVHHIEYKFGRDPWDYSPEELISYCADCHSAAEQTRADLRTKVSRLWIDEQNILLEILTDLESCSIPIAEETLYGIRSLVKEIAKEHTSGGTYKAELQIGTA